MSFHDPAAVEPEVARPHYAAYAGSIPPLTGAAASLTKNAVTPAIASGATACVITSSGNVARFVGVLSSWCCRRVIQEGHERVGDDVRGP
jgi:hypothetical protein